MDSAAAFTTLFASSFLSATLLPGGSELVLFALLKLHSADVWSALAIATLGNTLGGMTSYLIGRLVPQRKPFKGVPALQRYGSPALLFSWLPVIGDALCVAAGWLRINAWSAGVFMAIGKLGRYAVIAALTI
jgi:membrane protein YqaA with SNARE-associated domain